MTRKTTAVAFGAAILTLAACAPDPGSGSGGTGGGSPTTIVVTTTADVVNATDGVISLREAFQQASNDGVDSTIVVSSGSTYTLTLCGYGALSHNGAQALILRSDASPSQATITQTCQNRVMTLTGSHIELRGLVVSGGRLASYSPCGITVYGQPECSRGAGIESWGPLELIDSALDNNASVGGASVSGGGLSARQGVTATRTEFHNNTSNSYGGAIYSMGAVTLVDSRFIDNHAGTGGAVSAHAGSVTMDRTYVAGNGAGSGGGIHLSGATLAATDSTIASNTSPSGPGGAIWAEDGVGSLVLTRVSMTSNVGRTGALTTFAGVSDFKIIDSSITDNTSNWAYRDQYNRGAGGIATLGTSHIVISGSTIAYNSAPAGGGANIDLPPNNGTTIDVTDSIISDPQSSPANCELNGNAITVTRSLISDATCGSAAAPAGPALGPLVSFGSAFIRIPAAGSPAINAATSPCSTASDIRGIARPTGAACDLGAVEQ